ncbi:polymorphic toxin-type HINT domain-containing protein [Tuwongella immobilis]|uniref:Uncharacterized protein n=1 Tax=Tuwongella immobilis TaxID=692036 RepID=A0A6C2YGW2_9BACT|nr:polymorphic toxin-type HINT domain-containing protein [Tuwongella immobilis]VIP00760.1 YD repeat protein OS=Isosphaera pallida (strain ATCC 43644 / DSM 9630 / IS1B) GN=Isop_2419 PE=4 SV=1: PT-HINT: ParBc [Tuwongella immobilis]VTR96938.1 YD repeat protein OS=Isosphaera pallida (strain ATCC 43644 / DSM 9630 / IS1B) GN=Isop_2419 PE=4 SV=1: PT-HINT: ParBc [Tuwongella immobilis]
MAGTPLLIPGGSKAIEQFVPGDAILSRDETDLNGPIEVQIVEAVFERSAIIFELRVAGQLIETTAEHPFCVVGRGWTPVWELSIGDSLTTITGETVSVEGVHETDRRETVYNLRVSDYHTYFVGCDEWGFSVWAHNVDCGDVLKSLKAQGQHLDPANLSPRQQELLSQVVEGVTRGGVDGKKAATSALKELGLSNTKADRALYQLRNPVVAGPAVTPVRDLPRTQVDPFDLNPTHEINKSPREMDALRQQIRDKGFLDIPDEPVAYVVHNGKKYVVDGHHRSRIARELKADGMLETIPAVEVQLPYKGYRPPADLFDESHDNGKVGDMAIWQFELLFAPNAKQSEGDPPPMLASDKASILRSIDAFLPRRASWAEDILMWGEESGNRIHAVLSHGRIVELTARIDLREPAHRFLLQLMELAHLCGSHFVVNEDEQVQPVLGEVISAIKRSPSFRFVTAPERFIADLAGEVS